MAELETRNPDDATSPAPAENVGAPSSDHGPGTSETLPSTSEAPWTKLGYQSWEDLEQTHTRYKQQNEGSRAEAQRLQAELRGERERLERYEAALLQRQGAPPGGAAPPPQYDTLQSAYEAYLSGESPNALTEYEQIGRAHV